MRKSLLFLTMVLMTSSLWADDLTKAVQQHLKDRGFYYGPVDGHGSDETSAAIRRYQIRNGLRVTGQLDDETFSSLGVSRDGAPRPVPGFQEKGGGSEEQPGDDQYERQPPRQYGGHPFPQSGGPEDYHQMQPPRSAGPPVITSMPRLFGGTIYERASTQMQENVLYAVQGELMRRGLFRGAINGQPGPATSEAVTRLQIYEGLPVSGRLDNETLNDLNAFPGQHNGPPPGGFRQPSGKRIDTNLPASY
jgi:peptidoglycan hydrolase-like protein with peptidoglycan-binding domain